MSAAEGKQSTENADFGTPRPDSALVEMAEAVANALADRPQRCGHSSDPMCCPYENLPTLAEFFEPEPAETCGLDVGYGWCGLRPGHDDGLHAVPIGGGTDPIDDPEVWFVFGDDVEKPEYRSLRLEDFDRVPTPPERSGPVVCDHPELDHDVWWSYCWPCPKCGICKFIGHGPLCGDCYTEATSPPGPPTQDGPR